MWTVRVTIVAMLFLSTVLDLHVSVNNTKSLSVVMERQEGVPFALLSSYEVFLTTVNNTDRPTRTSCFM